MSRKFEILIGGLVLVLIIGAVLFFSVKNFIPARPPTIDGVALAGKLFLTLPVGKNNKLGIYSYDLSTQKLEPFIVNDRFNITPAFSHDRVAYMSRALTNPAYYQLFVGNVGTGTFTQESSDANQVKQGPIWSHDGTLVAYVVRGTIGTSTNATLPSSWFVFIADLAKHTQKLVSAGVDPLFSPDDKTLFVLQNDGIHAVDLQKSLAPAPKTSKTLPAPPPLVAPTITGTTTPASQTMKLALSPDATRLVWTVPQQGFVRVFRITGWEPLTLVTEEDLPVIAYYAVFSPDSQYLTLEEVDPQASPTRPITARLVAYHIGTYHSAPVVDLAAYSEPYIRLTAWR